MSETQHPSARALEIYSVDSSHDENGQSIGSHVASCSECRAYVDELAAAQRELQARLPAARFAHDVVRRADSAGGQGSLRQRLRAWLQPQRLVPGLTLAAGAVALVLFVVLPQGVPEAGLRTMGGSRIEAFVQQNGAVSRVSGRASVGAGDGLRFRMHLTDESYIAVFFADQQGRLSWPFTAADGGTLLQLQAGPHVLPGSALFDASQDSELGVVLVAKRPFTPDPLAQRLVAQWLRGGEAAIVLGDVAEDVAVVWQCVFDKH